tara:strand:+ start:1960 stop:2322 length:363 start_codon:yes stop_codon:yes gene_type:complete
MSETVLVSLLIINIIGLIVLIIHCVVVSINLNKIFKLLGNNNKKRINKIINLLENHDGQRQSTSSKAKYSRTTAPSDKKQFIKAKEVGELPPEIIAPSLKNPPRPAGGFGARVGKNKRDS